MNREEQAEDSFLVMASISCLMAAPVVWAYQIYHWLRWEEWYPISIEWGLKSIGVGAPQFDWVGVQKLSELFVSTPLSLFLIVLSWVLFVIHDKMEERVALKYRMWAQTRLGHAKPDED